METLAAFRTRLQAARQLGTPDERRMAVEQLRTHAPPAALDDPQVVVELLTLIRDVLKWQAALDFVDTLPARTRAIATVEEQRLLALAKSGDALGAATALEAFVATHGATPERLGLIGGRYKQLWLAAKQARTERGDLASSPDEHRWLDLAIARYEAGMQLDLNEFYCSSNLPRLLRSRAHEGDEARAAAIATLVVEQCQRLVKRDARDPWLRPTLLIAAMAAGNASEARPLLDEIRREGPAAWQVESVLTDIDTDLGLMTDAAMQRAMRAVRDELAAFAH